MPDVTDAEVDLIISNEHRELAPRPRFITVPAWPDGKTLMVAKHEVHPPDHAHDNVWLEMREQYRLPTKDEELYIRANMKDLRFTMGGPADETDAAPVEEKKDSKWPLYLGIAAAALGIGGAAAYVLWPGGEDGAADDEDDEEEDESDE